MSTVVCCDAGGGAVQTNHQFTETRTLTLKLSSFETQTERSLNSHSCWDFRNLTTSDSTSSSTYVPPTTNKSLPSVCLELCTENLGSESGSDASDHSNILSLLMSSSSSTPHQQPKQGKSGALKKMHPPAHSRSFPPPLTTIRGIHPIRVRPKREGGRLVIEAVEETKPCSYFRSERSHGHLRLCFWDDNEEEDEEEEEEENGGNCDDQDQIEEEEEEEEEEEGLNVRVEIGSQKFERRSSSRCKESSGSCNSKEGLCNWKPFWVAT